jgi:creatinine amidohydrolase
LRAAVERLTGQTTVGHADEIETSCMLALAPKSVTMARADAAWADMAAVEPGPLTPDDRGSPNYSRSGSLGDPRRASREKGELLLVAMVSDLLESAQAAVATATGPVATPAAGHESPP